jgi:O-antigen ligase
VWKSRTFRDSKFIGLGFVILVWFGWRAWGSPVSEFALADMLLLAGAAGVFFVIRAIAHNDTATAILIWSVGLLIAASVVVIVRQSNDPQFAPIFNSRPANYPSGFFGHYNDGANFLVGGSFLLGGMAIFGKKLLSTRITWGLVAIAGLIAVPFTHSRGGILAAVLGGAVFLVFTLILGRRTRAKWFLPVLVTLPLCGIAAGWYLLAGWQSAQEVRSAQTAVADVLDNSIRLHLVSIAASAIALHPLTGGGSGSFSWECYRFWDIHDHGWVKARPEMVHNEFLQSITDYGLIGGTLVGALIVTSFLTVLTRALFSADHQTQSSVVAMRVGGVAALVAVLVQSSFSFVFHLLPGALVLGAAFAFISAPEVKIAKVSASNHWPRSLMTTIGVIVAVVTLGYGWKGIRTSQILWPTHTARRPIEPSERSNQLAKAIQTWPQAALYRERALLNHKTIIETPERKYSQLLVDQTISNYQSALALHPYDVTSSINLANLLSYLDRDQEATAEYLRAVRLQGGFEIGFKSHFKMAGHLLKVGAKQLAANDPSKSTQTLLEAEREFDQASQGIPSLPQSSEGIALKNEIYENLAIAWEKSGDIDQALATYNQLTSSGSSRGHYHAGLLLGSLAKAAWSERRPSEALTRFQEARQRITLTNELPVGVTPESKVEYLTFLNNSIQYLVEAKVEPLKKPEE